MAGRVAYAAQETREAMNFHITAHHPHNLTYSTPETSEHLVFTVEQLIRDGYTVTITALLVQPKKKKSSLAEYWWRLWYR